MNGLKELMLKMEKMVQHSQSQKKLVDEETLNTMTLQVKFLFENFRNFVNTTEYSTIRRRRRRVNDNAYEKSKELNTSIDYS